MIKTIATHYNLFFIFRKKISAIFEIGEALHQSPVPFRLLISDKEFYSSDVYAAR